MVLSAIYILDMKGKVLISRNYRGDIENSVIDKFIGLVMDKEEDGTLTPLLSVRPNRLKPTQTGRTGESKAYRTKKNVLQYSC